MADRRTLWPAARQRSPPPLSLATCSFDLDLDFLPFCFGGVLYNCRALLLDGRLLLIRPKTALADDLCYREGRWFTAWTSLRLETVPLPAVQISC